MNTNTMKSINKVVFIIPLLWVLGFKFFIFHLLSLFIFIKTIITAKKNSQRIRISIEHKLLFIFIIIYATSIFINIGNSEMSRVIASVYNLTYWIIGLFTMISIYNDDALCKKDIIEFSKSIKNVGLFIILLFIISLVLWIVKIDFLSIDTPTRLFLPTSLKSTLLGDATNMYIYTTDWMFNRNILRFVGIFNYPAETAISIIFIILCTFYYYINKGNKGIKNYIVIGLLLISFIMALSRITWAGILLALFIVNVVLKISKNKKESLLKILKINLFIILCILVSLTKVNIIEEVYSSRGGSNEARVDIYKKAIELGKESIIFGTGMKPANDNSSIPIGSHSTYIGAFMKTGIVGFTILMCFFTSIVIRLVKSRYIQYTENRYIWYVCGVFLVSSLIWMITEDIDAPNIASFFFFINCSLITRMDIFKKIEVDYNE